MVDARHLAQERPNFYSRPCGRGDSPYGIGFLGRRHISTHAPAGGATSKVLHIDLCDLVNISTHAPAGGATCTLPSVTHTVGRFLLTPLREGRPKYWLYAPNVIGISTHAPAGGATRNWCGWCAAAFRFLLTPLREGRPGVHRLNLDQVTISTHAPAGGATQKPYRRCPTRIYFYSRPCGRGDAVKWIATCGNCVFLLTPLREGRLVSGSTSTVSELISTHAPAGGATQYHNESCYTFFVFLLTPLREGRRQFSTSPS